MTGRTSQPGCLCGLAWGLEGARQAAERGDIIVVVDTLCFSTCVAAAVHHGAAIFPCADSESAVGLARQVGGEVAVRREDIPAKGRFSLSPLSYQDLEESAKIVLPSPNGGACAVAAAAAPYVLAGALVNAPAVARAVSDLADKTGRGVTVVASGERSPAESLRLAVEDYLGAGAILSRLSLEVSPAARTAAEAFEAARPRLADLLWECESGRELRARGFEGDVRFAAALDLFACAPILRAGQFEGL